jgi:glycosyltransferase involved in cell wall biosynthesis
VPVKRPELFVELIAGLPGALGLVFGDGPRVATLGGADRVRHLGAIPDLWAHLAGLDALVLCSRREGCPLAALEAFAAGVPVVGFDVPGIRDALGGWGAGVLVAESLGVAGLRAVLERWRVAPDEPARLVERAREGLGRFAPAAVAASLGARYAAVVGRAAGR